MQDDGLEGTLPSPACQRERGASPDNLNHHRTPDESGCWCQQGSNQDFALLQGRLERLLSEKVLDAAQIAAESDLPKPCPPFPLLSPRPVHALRAPAHVEVSSKVAALAALPPPQRLPGPSVKALIAVAEAPESAAPSPVRGTQGRRHLKPMKSSHSFGEISIPDRPASEQREAPPSTRHPRKQREPAPLASPAAARGGTAPQATEHLARPLHVEAAQHHQSSEQQFVAQWF